MSLFPSITVHIQGCPCNTNTQAVCTCNSTPSYQNGDPSQIPNPTLPCTEDTEPCDPVHSSDVLWKGIERPDYGITKGASLNAIIMRLLQEIEILKQP